MLHAGAGTGGNKPDGARRLLPVWCNTALMKAYQISSAAAYSKTLQKLASRDPLLVYVLQKAVNALGANRRPRPPTLHVTADPAASSPELLGLRITACWWQGSGEGAQHQAGGDRSSVAGSITTPGVQRHTSWQNMQGHIVPALIVQHGAEVRGVRQGQQGISAADHNLWNVARRSDGPCLSCAGQYERSCTTDPP